MLQMVSGGWKTERFRVLSKDFLNYFSKSRAASLFGYIPLHYIPIPLHYIPIMGGGGGGVRGAGGGLHGG